MRCVTPPISSDTSPSFLSTPVMCGTLLAWKMWWQTH
jgi:hypothetical protein